MRFSPSLDEIQQAISAVAREVLECSRKINDWGVDESSRARTRTPFFERLAEDQTLAAVLLELAATVESTKRCAESHLVSFGKWELAVEEGARGRVRRLCGRAAQPDPGGFHCRTAQVRVCGGADRDAAGAAEHWRAAPPGREPEAAVQARDRALEVPVLGEAAPGGETRHGGGH